ncbi:hypothetical protein HID58_056486 [Brassica napus]|uniref:Uncharacterized protein n=1 Tax=Brassica napus TaxID=3708 RepID=A0ABQ8ANF6_BRANA|nr:hypothetical protein HID58_056486 [Brassica napus]
MGFVVLLALSHSTKTVTALHITTLSIFTIMSHRYMRAEKGKAMANNTTLRKPLVKVPESDISELIERNKFTLIGRVTNPAIQKTRALKGNADRMTGKGPAITHRLTRAGHVGQTIEEREEMRITSVSPNVNPTTTSVTPLL